MDKLRNVRLSLSKPWGEDCAQSSVRCHYVRADVRVVGDTSKDARVGTSLVERPFKSLENSQ